MTIAEALALTEAQETGSDEEEIDFITSHLEIINVEIKKRG